MADQHRQRAWCAIGDLDLNDTERKDALPPDPPIEARHRYRLRASVTIFLWRQDLLLGLTTHFIPPVVASLLLIRYGHLEEIKASRAGAYLQLHMTRTVEGVRFTGDIVMALGSWFHHPSWIALGLTLVILGWCNGLDRNSPSH
jgi:hypothetical protein